MTFLKTLKAIGIPEPIAEYQFAPPRRWRFDYAWIGAKLALEIDGGTWILGRHNRPSSIEREYEKFNRATILGWRVIHGGGRMTHFEQKNNHITRWTPGDKVMTPNGPGTYEGIIRFDDDLGNSPILVRHKISEMIYYSSGIKMTLDGRRSGVWAYGVKDVVKV